MNYKKTIIIIVVILLIGTLFFMTIKNISDSGYANKINQEISQVDDMNHHDNNLITENNVLNKDIKTINFDDAIGKEAPDFILIKQDNTTFKLSNYKGKNVILFFNEGAMCYPACWQQITALGQDSRLNTEEIIPVSIVVDSKEKWSQVFSSKTTFQKSNMLYDTGGFVSQAYGTLNLQSSMHKGSYPGHTYFIINKKGIIIFKLDDPNMAINNDVLFAEISKVT